MAPVTIRPLPNSCQCRTVDDTLAIASSIYLLLSHPKSHQTSPSPVRSSAAVYHGSKPVLCPSWMSMKGSYIVLVGLMGNSGLPWLEVVVCIICIVTREKTIVYIGHSIIAIVTLIPSTHTATQCSVVKWMLISLGLYWPLRTRLDHPYSGRSIAPPIIFHPSKWLWQARMATHHPPSAPLTSARPTITSAVRAV